MRSFASGDGIVVRVNEPTLSRESIAVLNDLRPIGVHFGKDAFLSEGSYQVCLKEFENLRHQILRETKREKMIFAIDHEGGRVNRLPSPFTRFSYPLNWEYHSREIGEAMGRELRSLGINVVFGPSLDIYSNSNNEVIGPRSFGRTPEEVRQYTELFIKGMESHGVLSTIKHFPGHGDTLEDSHFELPSLDYDLSFLRTRELVPFESAVRSGAKGIMLAHILFPRLDDEFPSSLSRACARTLLREVLQFEGVAFTDDLDMRAISDHYAPEQIAESLMSYEVNFGVFNHSYEHAVRVGECMVKISEKFPEALAKTKKRTDDFITALPMHGVEALPSSIFDSHRKLSELVPEHYSARIHEFLG